ncbi:unnamed protein product [Prorocentrum cordatum]|uniref:Uncharacterized protein n=1 Tax=Prorocentrum cordatum TaxID=2364126 RepID=A0ABN9QE34_9DINO|nr:unnamed protein product [Polarella glacialis]
MTFGPPTDTSGFEVHRASMRCLDNGFSFGLVDVRNSSAVELLLTKAWLVEFAHHVDVLANRGSKATGKGKAAAASLQHAVFGESAIVSEMTTDPGLAMVRPNFVAHAAPEVEHDVAVLELVCRDREETGGAGPAEPQERQGAPAKPASTPLTSFGFASRISWSCCTT